MIDDPTPSSASFLTTFRVMVAVVVAAVPLFFLRSTTEPFDTAKLSVLLVGVGVCLFILAWSWPEHAWQSIRPLLVPSAALLVPLTIATVLSPYRSWELIGAHARYAGLIPYVATILVAFLVAIAFAGRVHLLVWTITTSTSLVGGYALLQMFGIDPLDWFSSAYVASTLGHSNFSGAVLAIGLPLGVSLWMQEGRSAWLGRVSVVVMGVALIGSFSQGAWVAALGGCAVVVGSVIAVNRARARRVGYAIAALAAVVLVATVVLTQVFPRGPLAGSSAWTRGLHWRTALVMAADAPIVGHGANSYALVASQYRSPIEAMTAGSADDSHSVPLGIVAHAGLAGAVGLIVFMVWLLRHLRTLPPNPIWAGLVGSAVASMLVALVTVDHLVLRTLFWAVLGGIATYGMRQSPASRSASTSVLLAVRFALVAAAIGAVSFGVGILRADIHVAFAIEAVDANDPALGRAEFNRATGFGGQWEQRRLYGDAVGRAGLRNGVGDEELQELRRAFLPIIPVPEWTWRARFADWLTQWSPDQAVLIPAARSAWGEVMAINPHDPSSGLHLADLALLEGRPELALAELARFEAQLTKPYPPGVLRYPDYWGARAIAYEQVGNGAAARAALVAAETVASTACHTLIAQMILAGTEPSDSERLNAAFRCPPVAMALLDQGGNGANAQ